jgi:hypothetical protein
MSGTRPASWTWNSAELSASVLPRTIVSPPEVMYPTWPAPVSAALPTNRNA